MPPDIVFSGNTAPPTDIKQLANNQLNSNVQTLPRQGLPYQLVFPSNWHAQAGLTQLQRSFLLLLHLHLLAELNWNNDLLVIKMNFNLHM